MDQSTPADSVHTDKDSALLPAQSDQGAYSIQLTKHTVNFVHNASKLQRHNAINYGYALINLFISWENERIFPSSISI